MMKQEKEMQRVGKDWMDLAIGLSRQGMEQGAGGPFGAVIVKDGVVVGKGFNRVTSTNDPTAHAEMVAIRDACRTLGSFELKGCVLYTSCEPCPMCLGAVYWARLDRVYYGGGQEDAKRAGFDDSFIYQEIDKPKEARAIPMTQLEREEAVKVFEEWVQKEDKKAY